MIFVQTFDPRPGVAAGQIKELYFEVAAKWMEIWPSNKFVGLFEHKFVGAGSRPGACRRFEYGGRGQTLHQNCALQRYPFGWANHDHHWLRRQRHGS